MKRAVIPALALLLVSGGANGASTSRLVYARGAGADSCQDEAGLRDAVRERLGYDPFFPWAPETVVVRIVARRGKLAGEVFLVDSTGHTAQQRELSLPMSECGELVRAIALAIAITLDPLYATGGKSRPAPDAAPAPEVSADHPAPPHLGDGPSQTLVTPSLKIPSTLEPSERTEPRAGDDVTRLRIGLGALAAVGTMPGVSAGLAPLLTFRAGRVSIGIEGRFEFLAMPETATSQQVSTSLAGGAVVPCFHLRAAVGCPMVLLARYQAEGTGISAPREDAEFFAAAGIRVGAEWGFAKHFDGFVSADGLVNLTRHTVFVSGSPVWRVPVASLTLSAGAAVSIF